MCNSSILILTGQDNNTKSAGRMDPENRLVEICRCGESAVFHFPSYVKEKGGQINNKTTN